MSIDKLLKMQELLPGLKSERVKELIMTGYYDSNKEEVKHLLVRAINENLSSLVEQASNLLRKDICEAALEQKEQAEKVLKSLHQ